MPISDHDVSLGNDHSGLPDAAVKPHATDQPISCPVYQLLRCLALLDILASPDERRAQRFRFASC